jgi:hypothetical protein
LDINRHFHRRYSRRGEATATALSTEIPHRTIESDESVQFAMYHSIVYYLGLLQRIAKIDIEVDHDIKLVGSVLRSRGMDYTYAEDQEMRDQDISKRYTYCAYLITA